MTTDVLERQRYEALKASIDLLETQGRLHYDSLGQLLAAFPLSCWPPALFLPAWTLLQGHRDWLAAQGIVVGELPTPPDLSAHNRFIARHPVEGFALFFAPRREVSEAIKALGAWEYVPEQPHWIVYPVQGVGKALLHLAQEEFGFQLAEGVEAYAREIDREPRPLRCRCIRPGKGPREGQDGFDLYFPRSQEVRAHLNEITGRAFVDYPEPHWWVPAEPYQASDLLALALRHQFTIEDEALPRLDELVEQAEHMPPKPAVRRIEYDEAEQCFWVYCPPEKDLNAEIRRIPGASFPSKGNAGLGWRVPVTGRALAALADFIEAHPQFVCLPTALVQLRQRRELLVHRAQAATAQTAALTIEGLGGELRLRQVACVAYAQEVGFRVLIGDEVGIGKTPESLAILHVQAAFPALVITPANVKYNWEFEVGRWLPDKTIRVLEETVSRPGDYDADVIIVNYDLLYPRLEEMKAAFARRGGLRAIIADESHYIKNRDTQRTQAALALAEGVGNKREE